MDEWNNFLSLPQALSNRGLGHGFETVITQ